MKKTIEDAYKISTERLERVIAQQKYGKKTKLDVLNAKVDANSDSLNLLNITVLLQNNSRNLNYLLGREINKEFSTNMEVHLDPFLDYRILSEQLKNNNSNLKLIKINQEISKQELKINQAGWLPSISASASYGVNNNDNGPAGFFATQQSNGINAGINLSWNLFDGGNTITRVKNAKINLEAQNIQKEQLIVSVERNFNNAWDDYQNKLSIYRLQEQNIKTSQNNFNRTQEKFKLGQVNSIEFRQAQLNLLNAELSRNRAKYLAKLAEFQLLQLSGELLSVNF